MVPKNKTALHPVPYAAMPEHTPQQSQRKRPVRRALQPVNRTILTMDAGESLLADSLNLVGKGEFLLKGEG